MRKNQTTDHRVNKKVVNKSSAVPGHAGYQPIFFGKLYCLPID